MNTFGRTFRVSLFGESHGEQIGVVIDGVPAGLELPEDSFMSFISRRSPGQFGTTRRMESDIPHILSGVYKGRTTGAPLTAVFENSNVRSSDYSRFVDVPRPGHADRSAFLKWGGFNDPRGGGHLSGRMTLPAVFAGSVARMVLPAVSIEAHLISVGGCDDESKWRELLEEAAADGDSLGGIVECRAECLPVGLGEPFWDSAESLVSHAVFAIPGVRGIEFGDGFAASSMRGSQHNDPFGPRSTLKNGSGGVNGGITNGAPMVFRVAFKPTSSISREQTTWNFTTSSMERLRIGGRHDVCFALRTPVIVESMTAIVLADLELGRT